MKNRILITSFLAGVALCGLGAYAQPATPGPENQGNTGPGRPRMSFSTFDLNGDGSVTEDEFNKARSEMRGNPGPGGGMGRGPGNRGPGGPGGDVVRPRESRLESGSVTPTPSTDSKERTEESVERPEVGPRRERVRDGEGAQMRERRRDGAVGRPDGERPGMRQRADQMDRPGRDDWQAGEFRRVPGRGWDGGERQGRGPGGFQRDDRREMAAGRGPRPYRMERADRRPARDGMGPQGGRNGGQDAAGVCPNCGCPGGPRDGGVRQQGEGRGPRRMAPRS